MGGRHSSRPHVCPRNDTHRGWATLISSARLPFRLPPVPVCPSACTTTPVVGVYHPRRITTILILAYQHRSSSRIPLCKQVHFRFALFSLLGFYAWRSRAHLLPPESPGAPCVQVLSWHSLVPELAPLDALFRGVSVVPSWSTEPSVLVRDVNATLGFTGVISFAHLASPNLCLTRHLRSDFHSPSLSTVCDATTSVSTL
ncbi:hypothetical protein C8F01DRAFT_1169121, partial [Mycena amicta]